MNERTRVRRKPRQASPPPARRVAATIVTAALALIAAGCGGSASSTSTDGSARTSASTSSQTVSFSRCMRAHGVSSFPDPSSSGVIPKTQVAALAGGPQFPAAQRACQHLLPNTIAPRTTHAEVQAALSGMVRFAACMRSRGVQNWPDPTVDRGHPDDPRPVFDLHSAIDPTAPRITSDIHQCQHLMPQSTSPYLCSRVLAERIPGSPPGAEACGGGSPEVP
jgi:hypothetical protein